LDSLVRIEPFQGLAPTPPAVFSRSSIPNLFNANTGAGPPVIVARLLEPGRSSALVIESNSIAGVQGIRKKMSKKVDFA
jgi:hypothetical protein